MKMLLVISFFLFNSGYASAVDCSNAAKRAALEINNLTIPNSSLYAIKRAPNTTAGNLQYVVLVKESSMSTMGYLVEASSGLTTKACRIMKVVVVAE